MYRLRGVYKSQIFEYIMDQPAMLIGRDPKSKIRIDHKSVSRHHALIETQEGSLFITDLDSDNGTFLDGLAVPSNEKIPFLPGQTLRIGDRRFCLFEPAENMVDQTVAIKVDAKRPKGPIRAFPPDDPPLEAGDQTASMDKDTLEEMAEALADDPPEGPHLLVENGTKYLLPVSINVAEFRIGRAQTAHLRFEDESVSRKHCRIVRRKGRYYLYDSNSLNRTYLNGSKVRGTTLCSGDRILVGKRIMTFVDSKSPKTTADPQMVEEAMDALLQSGGVKDRNSRLGLYILIGIGGIGALIGLAILFLKLAGIM